MSEDEFYQREADNAALSDDELEAFFDDETLRLMERYEHMRKSYDASSLRQDKDKGDK